jgi:hypothetical protein
MPSTTPVVRHASVEYNAESRQADTFSLFTPTLQDSRERVRVDVQFEGENKGKTEG